MKVIVAIMGVFALILFYPLIGVLGGAFSGWAVGLFFEETIFGFLTRIGFDTAGYAMWQIGAALGFIGSFFRSTVTFENK